jgi:hypothetical protein
MASGNGSCAQPVQVIYQPPGALETTRQAQEKLLGPGAVAAGLTLYGVAEDRGWAKWVGGAVLAFIGWRWWNYYQEIKTLQPRTVLDVLTQANKDALAQGLTGDAKQQFLYKRVADAFGCEQAKQYVPAMGRVGNKSSRRTSTTDEPPPQGMNGL